MSSLTLVSRKILVIDDNHDAAETLCSLLCILGHDAHFAVNGLTGISLAESKCPDVIFLDIGMPDMDGFEVASALRKSSRLQKSLIVALSAWTDAATQIKAKLAGFDYHLGKPAQLESIQHMVAASPK